MVSFFTKILENVIRESVLSQFFVADKVTVVFCV